MTQTQNDSGDFYTLVRTKTTNVKMDDQFDILAAVPDSDMVGEEEGMPGEKGKRASGLWMACLGSRHLFRLVWNPAIIALAGFKTRSQTPELSRIQKATGARVVRMGCRPRGFRFKSPSISPFGRSLRHTQDSAED